MARKPRRPNRLMQGEDTDPLTVVVNLFDVAMVFAVSLMVAMVMNMNMTEVFTQEDFSVVKNPGKENMEIITKKGGKIERYTPSKDKTDQSSSRGRRVGVAYEMEDGQVYYVPEEALPDTPKP
nr:DUF2149 domain-containing protein [uncultured Porphyromonas sp.]